MVMITKLSSSLSGHMKKRCAYCDLDLGKGDDYPVVDFVNHLEENHQDILSEENIKNYRKLIEKATR